MSNQLNIFQIILSKLNIESRKYEYFGLSIEQVSYFFVFRKHICNHNDTLL